jgi:RNAse (barnase) inhibitor barstar
MPSPEIKHLFDSETPSGLYWAKTHFGVAELARLAKSKKMSFFHLEGQKIERKEQFFNHAAIAMKFPTHFGNNWDAFYDCITEFDGVESEGFVIYFDHTDAFATHHESQLETLVELFRDAIEFWDDEGKAMLVLMSGEHPPAEVKMI